MKRWWIERQRDGRGRFAPGERTTEQGGRAIAQETVPIRPCDECGAPGLDRHHIDGDPLNNDLGNIRVLCRRCHMTIDGRIERATQQMRLSIRRGSENPYSKLTEQQIREIRAKYRPRIYTQARLAAEYGVSKSTIGAVIRGQNWSWLDDQKGGDS